jgi:hypothetical protein
MTRLTVLSLALVVGTPLLAAAQPQYPPYAYPPAQTALAAPATPPSWSYDPYTSGLGPCTQKGPLDLGKCSDYIQPTYGQPYYGPPNSLPPNYGPAPR